MNTPIHRYERMRELLDQMASHMIEHALEAHPDIHEGEVLTVGPPAYRRLDCDGRALAYIRSRPRRGAVRVDVSGLWMLPEPNHLSVASAVGAAFLVRSYPEVELVLHGLCETIEATRRLERRAA